MIEFFVPLVVVPKNKKIAYGRGVLVDDARTRDNAKTLTALFWEHRPKRPMTGPVEVIYRFQTAWRKPDAKKRVKGLLPDEMPKTTRPDLGNLTKQADDCLVKAGFILDDAQIWNYGHTRKVWADKSGVHVCIEEFLLTGGGVSR